MSGHLHLVRKKIVHRLLCTRARRSSIIIEENDSALRHSWINKLAGVADTLVQVGVDMRKAKLPTVCHAGKCLREKSDVKTKGEIRQKSKETPRHGLVGGVRKIVLFLELPVEGLGHSFKSVAEIYSPVESRLPECPSDNGRTPSFVDTQLNYIPAGSLGCRTHELQE